MLSDQQIERFKQKGFLSGIPAMTDEQVGHYHSQFDTLEAEAGKTQATNKLFDGHFEHQFIWEIATLPSILECVEVLIGPNVHLLGTHFFCKYGPTTKFVAWHQDVTYWALDPPLEITAWVAIDDSNRENGCMRVIPCSHHQQIVEHGKSKQEGNLLSINQEVSVSEQDEQLAEDCVLKAGEMSLHEGMLLHGSLPNHSTRRRCGLAVRYIPTTVRPTGHGPAGSNWTWKPLLVRGVDQEHHFQPAKHPFPLAV